MTGTIDDVIKQAELMETDSEIREVKEEPADEPVG